MSDSQRRKSQITFMIDVQSIIQLFSIFVVCRSVGLPLWSRLKYFKTIPWSGSQLCADVYGAERMNPNVCCLHEI